MGTYNMDPEVELLDEDPGVVTDEERFRRYGQNDHKRVFGMGARVFLEEAGFSVEEICGEDCPDEVLPVVGPADHDINRLFRCVKKARCLVGARTSFRPCAMYTELPSLLRSYFPACVGRSMARILFTGAGRRVELVQAFREVALALGKELVVCGADSDLTAPALVHCDVAR